MSVLQRPKLQIAITPNKLQRGQMMAVQAYSYDYETEIPVIVPKFYMQIIDEKGVEVWPLSTIAENTDRIDKLISTAQLDSGQYQIRISTSKKLTPMAYSFFKIEKSIPPLAFALLIPLALGIPSRKKLKIKSDITTGIVSEIKVLEIPDDATPRSPKSVKVDAPIMRPRERPQEIIRMFYQTEIDTRVCPICRNHREVSFSLGGYAPDDPHMPSIGPEEFGGDTHWGCRCHYDITRDYPDIPVDFSGEIEAYEVYEAVQIAQQYWRNNGIN